MKKIITISREYRSGGREIGKKVAELLGYPYYDKEIIDEAAKQSGLSPEFIAKTEQNISSSWFYSLLVGSNYASTGTMQMPNSTLSHSVPLVDQVFNAQRKVIIDIAKKGPAVIVGRCADYILKHCDEINADDVLDVFVYAPLEDKTKRCSEEDKLSLDDARNLCKKVDKCRANHYNTFTESIWGARENYDLLINSSLLGLENSSRLIADVAKK